MMAGRYHGALVFQGKRNVQTILTPVSIGELVDKITILEIKAERITDPDKLARTDITGYYLAQLENLHPNIKKKEIITSLIKELGKLQEMLDTPQGVPLKAEQVAAWTKQGNKLLSLIAKTKGETKPKGEGGK